MEKLEIKKNELIEKLVNMETEKNKLVSHISQVEAEVFRLQGAVRLIDELIEDK